MESSPAYCLCGWYRSSPPPAKVVTAGVGHYLPLTATLSQAVLHCLPMGTHCCLVIITNCNTQHIPFTSFLWIFSLKLLAFPC